MDKQSDLEEKQYVRMTQTPLPKLITSLAVPTILSMMVTAIYSIADTYFVAQLSTSAAGAVGIVFSMMAIIQAVGFMVGVGASSNLSRFLGKRDTLQANIYASTALFMAVVLGSALGVLGVVFNHELMVLTGATPDILPYAKTYAHYIFIGTPVMCAAFTMNNMLRAQGKAILSTVGLGSGAILNIVLEPIFIFGFGMGIAGAAIATLISQCVSFAILLYMSLSPKTVVDPKLALISRDLRVYRQIIKNGVPSFLRQSLASIAMIALNVKAAVYGDAAVAAMSIVGRLSILFYSVMLGFGQGFQPVAGYNYGAGKFGRVKQGFRFCAYTGTAVMTAIGLVGYTFAPEIMALFRAEDAAVIAIGTFAFRVQCLVMPLQPTIVTTNMLFQSIGKSREATFLSVSRQGLYFLPLLFLLAPIYGLFGIQITQPGADILSFLSCFPILLPFLRELTKRGEVK